MRTNLSWTTPTLATTVHVLDCGMGEPSRSPGDLMAPLHDVIELLQAAHLPPGLLRAALPHAQNIDHLRKWLAESGSGNTNAQRVTPQPPDNSDLVIEQIRRAEALIQRQKPKLENELRLRLQPLRDQWLARGPGLARQLQRRLPLDGPGEAIRVVGLLPIRGGDGQAFPEANAVALESMLTNIDDRLPELARLAWLVVQIWLSQRTAPSQQMPDLQSLQRSAAVVTLQLATELDWFPVTPATVDLALRLWRLGPPTQFDELASQFLQRIDDPEFGQLDPQLVWRP